MSVPIPLRVDFDAVQLRGLARNVAGNSLNSYEVGASETFRGVRRAAWLCRRMTCGLNYREWPMSASPPPKTLLSSGH